MNIRKIVTYNNLRRQFTPEELAFADVLYNANEGERQLLVDALQPAKVAGKAESKPERCAHVYDSGVVCNGAKRNTVHHNSNHVDYHEFTTKKVAKAGGGRRGLPAEKPSQSWCSRVSEGGLSCGEMADHPIHNDKTYSAYHPFTSTSSPAPPAGKQSPRRTQLSEVDPLSAVNSAADAESAASVTGGD